MEQLPPHKGIDRRWLEIISVEAAGPKQKEKTVELFNEIRTPQPAISNVYGNFPGNEFGIHVQMKTEGGK